MGGPQVASDALAADAGRHVPALDAVVRSRLHTLGFRLRALLVLEGVTVTAGVLVGSAVVQFCLDYGTRGLRWSMRASLLALVAACAAWIVWRRILSPLRIAIGPSEVAHLVERRHPQLSSMLISAVRFSTGEVGAAETNSPALMASTIERAGRVFPMMASVPVLNAARGRAFLLTLLGVFIACVGVAWAAPEMTSLWFERNVLLRDVEWPRQTTLVLDARDGEIIGARGDDLVIEAHAEGVQPREVEFHFETAGGATGREMMATIGSLGSYRYRYTFKNAQEDFDFYLEGGDDRTRAFRARLLDRPRVERMESRIVPPAYARLPTSVLSDDDRSASLLPGSSVTIHVWTNKPVRRATLMAGAESVKEALPVPRSAAVAGSADPRENGGGEGTAAPATAGELAVTFVPRETQTYSFALVDEVGLESRLPARFTLRLLKDEPPRVRVRLEGVGTIVTPEAVLPIETEYADTYGLATVELLYQTSRDGAPSGAIEVPGFSPYSTTFTTSLNWAVAQAGVSPGDRLALLGRALDFDNVSGPNSAQSAEIAVRVVSREELLAELARREQEARGDLERLIDVQEQIRGKLLSELGALRTGQDDTELASRVTAHERRQRTVAGSVNVLRQQFEQILAELRVNQLSTNAAEQRIGGAIIEPLGRLAKRDLVSAADEIRHWGREPTTEFGHRLDTRQAALIADMREILSNMLQWEGYQEAVNMLRDILRIQAELEAETRRTLEQQGSDIFDK